MKPCIALCVTMALCSGSLLAQSSLSLQGRLARAKDHAPIDFANVLLRSPKDSTLITGAVTDSLGHFQLSAQSGDYLLEVRALGYQPVYQSLQLRQPLDLGELLLSEEATELSAVHVAGKRPIMLRKADRMVFDATQIAPAASSALDVLRQTPGVNVSDDGISLIGKGAVIILINDKRVRLSGKALTSLLRSYPQSELQEIQILSTPPAKYEAEGNAGVLNLILKKLKNDYFGGSITLNANRYGRRLGADPSINLNYKRGKTTASLQLGAGSFGYLGQFATYRTYPAQQFYTSSETDFDGRTRQLNLRGGLDYELTSELTVGFNVTYSPSKDRVQRTNDTRDYAITPEGSRRLQSYSPGFADEEGKRYYTSANIHLEKSFKAKPGRRLAWDVDYAGYQTNGTNDFSSSSFTPQRTSIPGSNFRYHSLAKQQTDSYLTSIDYTTPLGKSVLSFGAKGTWTRTWNTNDLDARSTIPERHDKIRFDEHIYALYADLQHPFSDQWQLRTGLRAEYTHTAGENNGRALTHLKSYLNIFPTLYLGFTPSERHAFNVEAALRLNRPHFSQLSPFARYENQNSTIQGKEDLGPGKKAKFALGYTFLGRLNLQTYASYNWDAITQVIRLDPQTNQARYSIDNAGRSFTAGFESSYTLTSLSFLQCYLSQAVEYTDSRSIFAEQTLYSSSELSYRANLNGTFFFNRSKTFQGTLFASYSSPQSELGTRSNHLLFTGAGLAYSLLQGKLRLAVDVNNFIALDNRSHLKNEAYELEVFNSTQRWITSLQLTYSFGASLRDKAGSKHTQELRSRM